MSDAVHLTITADGLEDGSTQNNRWTAKHSGIQERFGAKYIRFRHPAGLLFEVVEDPKDNRNPWTTKEISDRTYMDAHLASVVASSSINYVDLTPTIDSDEASTSESALLPCNGHWSAQGHAWVADALYQYLTGHRFF